MLTVNYENHSYKRFVLGDKKKNVISTGSCVRNLHDYKSLNPLIRIGFDSRHDSLHMAPSHIRFHKKHSVLVVFVDTTCYFYDGVRDMDYQHCHGPLNCTYPFKELCRDTNLL